MRRSRIDMTMNSHTGLRVLEVTGEAVNVTAIIKMDVNRIKRAILRREMWRRR